MENYKKAKLNDAGGDINKQWYVYYSYRHPETNQYCRFKQLISFKLRTKTARHARASEIIKQINDKLLSGFNPFIHDFRKTFTLRDALIYFLDVKTNILRSRSVATYRNNSTTFLAFLEHKKLDTIPITNFTHAQAIHFLDWTSSERKTANRTINNYRVFLITFFNFLIEREIIEKNPFNKIKKIPEEEAEIIAFTQEELDIVRNNLPRDNYRLYLCTQLIFYCFIRPAELMRLRYKDIDLKNKQIYIHAKINKNKKEQSVQIPNQLYPLLVNLLSTYRNHDHLLFTRHLQPGTKQAAPTRMAEYWRQWANRYNIKKNIYHFKHTGAGLAIDAGINPRDLQLHLRHSDLRQTQIYLDKFRKHPSTQLRNQFPNF